MNKPEYQDFKIPGHNVTVKMLILQGKQYLEVKQRVVWFNLERPLWSLETEVEKEWLIKETPVVRYKCTIKDETGRIMRTARKTKIAESDKDFDTCETGAIGRALSLAGFGTAYSEDMEEGDDLADSPQPPVKPNPIITPLKPDREAAAKRVAKTQAVIKKMEGKDSELKLEPLYDHEFSGCLGLSGRWTEQSFPEIFKTDRSMGFDWTMKRNEEHLAGKDLPPWAIDYLVYAADCGLSL